MHNLLNEYTDLSQRLEHLVAYSSQMVFISGEHMGSQKDFVEAFLSTRQDDLDVIYITGNNFHGLEDVRSEFARQLLGEAPRLELSLLQLITTRENKRKPLLIAITRAERLPDQILQELWDLVLQNRFARNQQQINILLFGEQEWAEKTKSWLPTNNNDKPVLLTSETVEVQAEQEVEGDLEEYIKAKRQEFNNRLKNRALSYEPAKSVWSNWWVKLLAVCAFIICFSSIMIWQYFDLTKAAVDDFTGFLFQNEVEAPTDEWQQAKELLAETAELTEAESEATEPTVESEETQGSENAAPETITPEIELAKSDQERVTSWQEASKKLERQSVDLNLPEETQAQTQDEALVSNPQPETMPSSTGGLDMYKSESLVQVSKEKLLELQPKVAQPEVKQTPPAQEIASESTTEQTEQLASANSEPTVITEPYEDLPTMAQTNNETGESGLVGPPAPARTEITAEEATTQAETPVETAQTTTDTSNFVPVEESVTSTTAGEVEDYQVEDIVSLEELPQTPVQETLAAEPQPSYLYDEATLMSLPESSYLLQVSGISSKRVLDEYLVDNRLTDKVWIYKTRRYGGDWHVVLFKKSFSSLNQARDSVSELPQTNRQSAPFAKSISMIKSEIEQGYEE